MVLRPRWLPKVSCRVLSCPAIGKTFNQHWDYLFFKGYTELCGETICSWGRLERGFLSSRSLSSSQWPLCSYFSLGPFIFYDSLGNKHISSLSPFIAADLVQDSEIVWSPVRLWPRLLPPPLPGVAPFHFPFSGVAPFHFPFVRLSPHSPAFGTVNRHLCSHGEPTAKRRI